MRIARLRLEAPSIPLSLALLLVLASVSCVKPPVVVPDAEGIEALSAIGVTCKRPEALTQDCSSMSGTKRKIKIGDLRMKIAGSEDGHVILLTGPNPNSGTLSGSHGSITNTAYEVVKRILYQRGIEITSVTPVASAGQLYGYIVKTDTDAYSILKAYSIE